jgi:hypothetical protein
VSAVTVIDLASDTASVRLEGALHNQDGGALVSCDLNGDGIEDLVSGSDRGPGVRNLFEAGDASVFFGRRGAWSMRASLFAERDVLIGGAEIFDSYADALACGDVNGDGFDDLILSAPNAKGPANTRPPQSGEVAIVFGRAIWPSEIDLLTMADVTIWGPDGDAAIGSFDLASGDINGDGLDDVIIDLIRKGPTSGGTGQGYAGRVVVLFGRTSWSAEVDLAAGADLELRGDTQMEFFGASIETADLDRDGKHELLVGATFADAPGNIRADAGEIHVFRGRNPWPALIDLQLTSADLVFYGADIEDRLGDGDVIASGDIDGNGWLDLLGGAYHGDGPLNNELSAGEIRIIEPRTQLTGTRDARTQSKASIYGAEAGDWLGGSVYSADVNADGFFDIVGSTDQADGPDNVRPEAGEVQIVFGRPGFPGSRDLGAFPEYQIIGEFAGDQLFVEAVSDINADGLAEIVAAANTTDNELLPVVWIISPFDTDGDGWQQLADNCPLIANPDQADSDGDRLGDLCVGDYDGDSAPDQTDCRPSDRLQGRPGDLRLISMTKSGTTLTLTWQSAASAERYDVVRNRLSQIAVSQYGPCQNARDPNLGDTSFVEPELPPAGDGFSFLIRGRDTGCGGVGSWGVDSTGAERINQNSQSCP